MDTNLVNDNPYAMPSEADQHIGKKYGGIRRLAFFFYLVFSGIMTMIARITIGAFFILPRREDPPAVLFGGLIYLACLVVYIGVVLLLGWLRLTNIGATNPAWCIGLLVPMLNVVIGIRCLVCPEGYDDHRELDPPGKLVLGLTLASVIMLLILVLFSA